MHRGNRQCFGGELDALAADARQEDLTFQGPAFLRARLQPSSQPMFSAAGRVAVGRYKTDLWIFIVRSTILSVLTP
jgi:hypothetical protein